MIISNTAKQYKRQYEWLKDYQWKPGQSGNPKGGKPGKTLKKWAEEFLMELPDDKKLEFLRNMPADIVWKMAEGNPKESSDITSGGKPIPLLNVLNNDSVKEDSETEKEN